jgi:putative iron-regulated protein
MFGCAPSDEPSASDEELSRQILATHADGAHALYTRSLASAREMSGAIDAFLAAPDEAGLSAARTAWLSARDDYGLTEALRFSGGPIDDADGPEPLLNSWPLDEAFLDYVEGAPLSGIVNRPAEHPDLTRELLIGLNQAGGEENVATGWHAIEFLLWGQDLWADSPGRRPASDYTTAPHAARRARYLALTTALLLEHLEALVDEWAPDRPGNYREAFLALPVEIGLQRIVAGSGELTRGELAGERMLVAYENRSQEDEHSCYSDNTLADLLANARGLRAVLAGDYGEIQGPGPLRLFAAADAAAAARLESQLALVLERLRAIPPPFDRHLGPEVADDDPGRRAVLGAIVAVEDLADRIAEAAAAAQIVVGAGVSPES